MLLSRLRLSHKPPTSLLPTKRALCLGGQGVLCRCVHAESGLAGFPFPMLTLFQRVKFQTDGSRHFQQQCMFERKIDNTDFGSIGQL